MKKEHFTPLFTAIILYLVWFAFFGLCVHLPISIVLVPWIIGLVSYIILKRLKFFI